MAKVLVKNECPYREFKKFHSWFKKIGGEIPLRDTEKVIDKFKNLKTWD